MDGAQAVLPVLLEAERKFLDEQFKNIIETSTTSAVAPKEVPL